MKLFQIFKRKLAGLQNDHRGNLLLFVMIFGAVAVTMIISGVATYAIFENQASNKKHNRDVAFHIAEAGINYYRWHLAHNTDDYTDGTGLPGPYVREHDDKDGNVVGYYSLSILEPLSGATVITVSSTGWTVAEPAIQRTIQVRLGFPALTDYAFIENADMNFSPTSEVHGKVHSNGGIKFDGTSDAEIESAKETYTYNNEETKPGVWGDGGPVDFWNFPVPVKDFFGITADMGAIQSLADDGGIHLNSSGAQGWHLDFLNNGTFNLYKVTSVTNWGYTSEYGWGQFDINAETYQSNMAIPANGAIFVEDHVWVGGTVNGRVTVAAGRLPEQASAYRRIYITNNLLYSEKSSDDVIGLIAQSHIIIPKNVPTDMEIDAAALSQYGQIVRPYYAGNTRNSLTFFGSQISYSGGGMKWGNPVVSGFVNTNYVYDGNLRYYPPPGFPVEPTYELISWEEIE